ncbi:hypothetical protein BRARA_J00106 [Brassica rapa]|uniref:ADP-ribosylation factor n=1 Tax=Brassica campestris TaxID=3711 RepID=A0A397XNQ6_BRACM|nr:hypothetical protein BRARA_J00106 [Brassica rapa]
MGTTFGKPFAGLFQEPEPRIMSFGLGFTGKSSILLQLKTGEILSKTRRTIAGFVYVVDSTDRKGMEEAKSFLYMVMDEIDGNAPDNTAVLVYANKHEVPGAMSASEISNELDLPSLRQRNWQRNWHVQSSCALCGDGIHEGFDWLFKNIARM